MYRSLFLAFVLLMLPQVYMLLNFNSDFSQEWEIVDDVVMGGASSSTFAIDENGNGVFEGEVSLANNGGFASVRFDLPPFDAKPYSGVRLTIKGDGKPYQFRIRNSYLNRFSYTAKFSTNREWQTVEIPFSTMIATFRGYRLDLPRYEGDKIEEVAFLIGNKKAERFKLLIDKIELY